MKNTFSYFKSRVPTLFIILFLSISAHALTDKVVARHADVPLAVTDAFSAIQWQISSDNSAWYNISGATVAQYSYKADAPAYIRAELTNSGVKTYSEVYKIAFEVKSYLKKIKSSGGQCYAENANRKPASGVSIQEDRGSNGTLQLTAISNNWTAQTTSLVWYLYTTAGEYDIDILLRINSGSKKQFELSVEDINGLGLSTVKTIISVTGKGANDTLAVSSVKIPQTGFYRYELKPLSNPENAVVMNGFLFKSIDKTTADVHATNYLSSPSVHLSNWRSTEAATTANQKYDWCYEEILVPQGGDALATYYMSLGVLSGYMGMQVNSETERGIIFSMWDDGDTDKDPTLDQLRRAGAVDADPATTVSRFGNEGTGTKSFVHGMNWTTGVPVKFLTNSRLEEYNDTLKNKLGADSIVHRRNTLVSAWFNSDPQKGWRYISTLRMPNKVVYFDSWYSFLENYGYTNGQIRRKAYYYNAFAHEQSSDPANPGKWRHFNVVNFGNTDGAAGQRIDFEQGATTEKSGAFYMATGGYGSTVKTSTTVPLRSDRSVVTSLDLTLFNKRVDEAIAKEKHRNDSIKSVQLADKTGWKVVAFSSEETSGEGAINGRAKCVIDKDATTFWHSKWTGSGSSFPHSITVEMDKVQNVKGFMLTLSGGTTRHMKNIEVYGSTDGLSFDLLHEVAAPDAEKFYIPLPETQNIKFFKLKILDSQSGEVHCRINEIDLVVGKSTDVDNIPSNSGFSLFPNPAHGRFFISFEEAQKNVRVEVLNLKGKLITQKQYKDTQAYEVTEYSTSNMPKGMYVVRSTSGKKSNSNLLMVQ